MWITSFMAKNKKENTFASFGSITSSGNGVVGVSGAERHVNVPVVTPSGIECVPKKGCDAVVAVLDLGEMCLGVVSQNQSALLPGEIKLYSEGASITLKNDGRILLEGKVLINGKEVT